MKVSVITATYNSGTTLRDTLESVLAQTYPDIEHIVVDGGSTDNTMELVREYEPRYNGRLRYVSEPDKGIYDAMNKGIGMATGEVIGILNSDDFYTSADTVETLIGELERLKVDAVFGDIHFVDSDNLGKCVRYYSSAGFRRWKMLLGFMPAHPSFYCRKEAYERFGLFKTFYKVAADFGEPAAADLCGQDLHQVRAERLRDNAHRRGFHLGLGKPSADHGRPCEGLPCRTVYARMPC